jgi:RNA polymerase-binding protein DksA
VVGCREVIEVISSRPVRHRIARFVWLFDLFDTVSGRRRTGLDVDRGATMARTTAGKLAGKTAAAAKKVTGAVAEKVAETVAPPAQRGPAEDVEPTPTVQEAPRPARSGAPAARKAAAAAPARKAPAKKVPATRSKGAKGAAGGAVERAAGQDAEVLTVKPGEEPWTPEELAEVRDGLTADVVRLQAELDLATRELDGLMRDAGDGAGNDQADVGSTTFERDHELSLANHARDMLLQTQHALERIADGTYGVCESCGQPIGKNRLMAFPRATLCLTCKQREERR